jgi:hypothetical protein
MGIFLKNLLSNRKILLLSLLFCSLVVCLNILFILTVTPQKREYEIPQEIMLPTVMEEIEVVQVPLRIRVSHISNVKEFQQIVDCVFSYQDIINPITLLAIISSESDFTYNIDSFLGAKYGRGLMQVSDIALLEYNNRNKTNIEVSELYDIETNIKVGVWVFLNNERYIKSNNPIDLYLCYNIGCGIYNKYRDVYYGGYTESGKSYEALTRFIKILDTYSKL